MANLIFPTVAFLVFGGSILVSSGQDVPIIQGPNPQAPKESSTQAPQSQASNVSCQEFVEQCEGCEENSHLCAYLYQCQDPQYAENDYWCMSLTFMEDLPKYCESCKKIEPGCKNATAQNCPGLTESLQKGGIFQNLFPSKKPDGKCREIGQTCQSARECCKNGEGASCEDTGYNPSNPSAKPLNKTCVVLLAEENPQPGNSQGGTGNGNENGNGNGNGFIPFPPRPSCNADTCSADDKTCCNGKFCATPKTVEEKYECKNCLLSIGSVCFTKPDNALGCCGGGLRPSACAIIESDNNSMGICVECPRYNRQHKNAPCETDSNCCESDPREPAIKYECRPAGPDAKKKTCVKCVKEGERCNPNGGAPCCAYPVGTACFKNFSGSGYSCQFSREEEVKNTTISSVPK